jgi:hypothetical protein
MDPPSQSLRRGRPGRNAKKNLQPQIDADEEPGIAAKTCRAIGLAEAERIRDAKERGNPDELASKPIDIAESLKSKDEI